MGTISLYAGAALVILWGIAHIAIPTRAILNGFEPIATDNRRLLLMEWLTEGVLIIFISGLVVLVNGTLPDLELSVVLVYLLCGFVLIVMAGISLFTGARTAILPMKQCPPIFLTSALLLIHPTIL